MFIKTPKFPKRIEIELASSCNLQCVYCPRKYLDNLKGFVDFNLFVNIIDQLTFYPETILVLHRRGESMLHPKFNEMLGYVKGKFKEVQMATNGTLLDKEKFQAIVDSISFLSFSLDSPLSYNKKRFPADYKTVEEKILKFLEFNKGRIKTQVSMVKSDDSTKEEIDLFKETWLNKVDRVRIYEQHSINGVFGALKEPREQRKPCVMPFYEFLVYDNGKVGRCNHDWDGSVMGDLNIQTIQEVWNSDVFNSLRKQHLNLEFDDLVCKNCDCWYPEEANQGTGEIVKK